MPHRSEAIVTKAIMKKAMVMKKVWAAKDIVHFKVKAQNGTI